MWRAGDMAGPASQLSLLGGLGRGSGNVRLSFAALLFQIVGGACGNAGGYPGLIFQCGIQ